MNDRSCYIRDGVKCEDLCVPDSAMRLRVQTCDERAQAMQRALYGSNCTTQTTKHSNVNDRRCYIRDEAKPDQSNWMDWVSQIIEQLDEESKEKEWKKEIRVIGVKLTFSNASL